MGIREVLSTDADFAGLTAQQAVDLFKTTIVIGGSSERWTQAGVADRFDISVSEQLYASLKNAGMEATAQTYVHAGIDLSNPKTQENLVTLQAAATGQGMTALADACGQLKEIGITHGPKWSLPAYHIPEEPTLQQVADAMEQNAAAAWWANVQFEVVPPLLSSGSSVADLKSAIAGA